MEFKDLEHIAKLLGILAGIPLSIFVIWSKVILPIFNHFKKIDEFFDKVNVIHKEVRHNGGESIKDVLGKIYNKIEIFNSRLAVLLDLDVDPIYQCDLDGKAIFGNKAILEFFGLDFNEFLDFGWLKGIDPKDRERVFDCWMNCVKKQIPYECTYTVYNSKTGAKIEATTVALPLKNEDGVVFGYMGLFKK